MTILTLFLIVLVAAMTPSAATAQGAPFPNAWGPSGQYNGTLDRRGNLYGPDGKFFGQVERRGLSNRSGDEALSRGSAPRFRSSPNARAGNQAVYGTNGQYLGYVDRTGSLFDAQGTYKGRLR